jgi:hypothetical protein
MSLKFPFLLKLEKGATLFFKKRERHLNFYLFIYTNHRGTYEGEHLFLSVVEELCHGAGFGLSRVRAGR